MRDEDKSWVWTLPAPALALTGALLCGHGFLQGREGRSAASWPTTEGRITRADVSVSKGQGSMERVHYDPLITYSYSVDGVQHEGRATSLPAGLLTTFFERRTRASAESVVASYRPGSAVTVYYQRANPTVAVLQPGASGESNAELILGLIALGMAVWRHTQG